MKRIVLWLLVVFVLVNMFAFISGVGQVKALDSPPTDPTTQVMDFKNGTKEMIIDFHNGTRNCIAETYVKKTAEITATNETDQILASMPIDSACATFSGKDTLASGRALSVASTDESVNYVNTTQTMMMKEQMMLGFTYTLAYWQEEWKQEGGWWIFSWYLEVGVDIDIQFGLRLPINVTLQYPEHMTIGNNYTIQATLDPVDKPDFNELLLTCKANIWAQAGLAGIDIPRTVLFGPDFDDSQSFVTPFGSDSASLGTIRIDIFEIIKDIFPSLKGIIDIISEVVVPYLDIEPTFGSNLITANASSIGDGRVVEGENLSWSEPDQTQNFTVNADEYDPATNYSRLVLSDFRYFFTEFGVDFSLEFDLNYVINFFLGIGDPVFYICTLDISWIIKYIGTRFVTSHSGYPGSIYIALYVDRIVDPSPPTSPPEDIAISYAYAIPPEVKAGDVANITVGAKNLGNVSETFDVTIYADNTILNLTSIMGLAAGEEIELNFGWNTTGFAPWHAYNITAEASTVPNEIDLENNVLSAGTVEVVLDPPNANFTYSPVPPIQNQTTIFNASVSTLGSGPIVAYEWNFGEGVNLTTSDPIIPYVFAYYGNHRVTLTVIDSNGLNSTFSEVINVTSNGHVGDVNGDGIVDIYDALLAGYAFGSRPGEPRWNPAADTNQDGLIDIFDMIPISKNFGNVYT